MNIATLHRRHPSELSVLALLIALTSGCASTSTAPEAVASEFIAPGRIAVVTARYTPETYVHSKDTRGSMAGRQAAYRGLGGAAMGLVMPFYMGPLGIALYPIIAPVTVAIGAVGGGVVGAVEGAAKGMSASRIDPLHPTMERALREQKMPDAMAQRVLQEGAALPHYQFAYLSDAGPASATHSPDYQRLKADGFDSVLELSVVSVGFQATKGEPPSAVFEMQLRARVVPLSGNGSASVRELQYRSQWRGVPQWAADDGRPLEEELAASYASLAGQVSQAAFWPVSAE
jgi:hypothetical protein